MFRFLDPGKLTDGDLELVLIKKVPADPARQRVPVYRFRMRLTGQRAAVGSIELRVGDSDHLKMYAGQIGYGVLPRHRGHRYAARGCKLLLPLARTHGLKELWITCDPDNLASKRTCELAGAEFVEMVEVPEHTDLFKQGDREKCRYRIDLEGLQAGRPGT